MDLVVEKPVDAHALFAALAAPAELVEARASLTPDTAAGVVAA
jgi:hypothetical protein